MLEIVAQQGLERHPGQVAVETPAEFGQRVRPSQGSITSNVLMQLSPGIAGAGLGAANAQDDPIMGALTGGALGFGMTAVGRQAFRRAVLDDARRWLEAARQEMQA